MKNVLIAVLLIGLAVSLWFNWKGKPTSSDPNIKTLQLGKDSLKIKFYMTKDSNQPANDSNTYLLLPCNFGVEPCQEFYAYGRPPINDTSGHPIVKINYPYFKIDIVKYK